MEQVERKVCRKKIKGKKTKRSCEKNKWRNKVTAVEDGNYRKKLRRIYQWLKNYYQRRMEE